jgi:WD40 repeat protein
VVFSPDGSRVASGSDDETLRVWDVQTGQCQHTPEGHSAIVTSVVVSPDGSRMASGSDDRTVRMWDVQTGQCQHALEGHSGQVTSVMFSPDVGTRNQRIEFTDDSMKIAVNDDLSSIPSQTRLASTTAGSPWARSKSARQ